MRHSTTLGLLLFRGGLVLLASLGACSPAFAGSNSTATGQKSAEATAPVPRVIEPGVRLGPVTAASTLESLRASVGKRNVSLEMVQAEEGKGRVSGAVLYPNDPKKRIELAWDDTLTKSRPRWARVRNAANWWHTPTGVRVGSTLLELEKLNGRAFTVTSFRAGERRSQVRTWNKGNLADELEKKARVWLAVPTATTKSQMVPLSQGTLLPSGDPPLRHINPHVTEISTRFDLPS